MLQKLFGRSVLMLCFMSVSIAFALDVESLEKECNSGKAIGCFNLGVMYYIGESVKQDKSKAEKLFGDACDMGIQRGCDDYRELNEAGVQ